MKLIGQANHFNSIRLVMALLVIWSHSFAIHLGTEKGEWLSLLLSGVFNAGNIGVMGFFVISGFLIAQSWERSKSLRSYMNKRVRRIYPGYMVATIISGAVMVWYVHATATFGSWARSIALNLLLRGSSPVPDALGVYSVAAVNGALWSIPFEFWCYIGVAALGLLGLASRRWFLVAALVAIMAAHVILDALGKSQAGASSRRSLAGRIFGRRWLRAS